MGKQAEVTASIDMIAIRMTLLHLSFGPVIS